MVHCVKPLVTVSQARLLCQFLDGKTYRGAAAGAHLSYGTAKVYMNQIRERIGLFGVWEMALWAARNEAEIRRIAGLEAHGGKGNWMKKAS